MGANRPALDAVATDFVMREWKQHPGKMSEYIRWYRTDFGKDPQSLQAVLAGILTRSEAFAGVDGRVVVWLDYDWALAVPEVESTAAPAAP